MGSPAVQPAQFWSGSQPIRESSRSTPFGTLNVLQFSSGIVSPVKYLAVLRPAQDPCGPLPGSNRFSLPWASVRALPSVRSTGLIVALLPPVLVTLTVWRKNAPGLAEVGQVVGRVQQAAGLRVLAERLRQLDRA